MSDPTVSRGMPNMPEQTKDAVRTLLVERVAAIHDAKQSGTEATNLRQTAEEAVIAIIQAVAYRGIGLPEAKRLARQALDNLLQPSGPDI